MNDLREALPSSEKLVEFLASLQRTIKVTQRISKTSLKFQDALQLLNNEMSTGFLPNSITFKRLIPKTK